MVHHAVVRQKILLDKLIKKQRIKKMFLQARKKLFEVVRLVVLCITKVYYKQRQVVRQIVMSIHGIR